MKRIISLLLILILLLQFDAVAVESNWNALAPVTLGQPIKDFSLSTFGATYVVNGDDYYFAPTNGGPLYVYNLDKKEIVSKVETGISTPWGCDVDSEGNVYISGTGTYIYKYNPFKDYGEKLPSYTNNSSNFGYSIVYDEDHDALYWGTYPEATIYKYDLKTKTCSNFGIIDERCTYVRTVNYHKGYVYANMFGSTGSVATKTIVKINVNNPMDRKIFDVSEWMGSTNMSNSLSFAGDVLMLGGVPEVIAFDTTTDSFIDIGVHDKATGPVSTEKNGKVYFPLGSNNELFEFDVVTKKATKIEDMKNTGNFYLHTLKNGWVTIEGDDRLPGESLFTYRASTGDPVFYNFESKQTVAWTDTFTGEGTGIIINAVGNGPVGKNQIYIGGFRVTNGVIYDISKNEFIKVFKTGNQTDKILYYEGKMYLGTYTGAVLREYDPITDTTKQIISCYDQQQTRIHALACGDGKVFFGTIPDYGYHGGGIGWYDVNTGETFFDKNIVPDQCVTGIIYKDGFIYGVTSNKGGGGTTPKVTDAKVFVYDVANKKLVKAVSPNIPGIASPPRIAAIGFDKSGRIWCQVSYTFFTFDPETGKCEEQLSLSKSGFPGGLNREVEAMEFLYGPDGYMYVSTGSAKFGVIRFDPDNPSDYKTVLNEAPGRYTFGEDGNFYYTTDINFKVLPIAKNVTDDDVNSIDEKLTEETVLLINSPYAVIKGKTVQIDEENSKIVPYIYEDKAYVPLRFISESLGCYVEWNANERFAKITQKDTVLKIYPDKDFFIKNNNEIKLESPAHISDSRLMLPLRAVSEALDMKVLWNDNGVICLSSDEKEYTEETITATKAYLKFYAVNKYNDSNYSDVLENDINKLGLKSVKLENYSFEDKVIFGKTELANGLKRTFIPDENSYIGISEEIAFEGKKSLKISNAAQRKTSSVMGCETALVRLDSDKLYKLYMSEYPIDGKINFGFNLYDSNKKFIERVDVNTKALTPNVWKHWVTLVPSNNPNAEYFSVCIYSDGVSTGTSYFDTLMIYEY